MKDCDISIIVPIYNAEKYIEKCVTTLFEQDYNNIEFVFVNDCSLDKSMEILENTIEKYPNRKNHVKIVNNFINICCLEFGLSQLPNEFPSPRRGIIF